MKTYNFLFASILGILFAKLAVLCSLILLFNEIGNFEDNAWSDLKTFQKYSEDAWQLMANKTREKRSVYRIKLPPRNNGYGPRYVTIPPMNSYSLPQGGGMPPPAPPQCAQGPPGRPGHPGHPGEDGSAGHPGSPGGIGLSLSMKLPYNGCIQCPMGPTGSPGRTGPMGHPGDSGMPGGDGIPGARGLPGDPGILGDRGMEGTRGHPGADGQPGRHGTRSFGSPGPSGNPGRPGPPGPPGFDGGYPVAGGPGAPGPPGRAGQPGQPGIAGHPGMPGGSGGPGPDSGYCQCPSRGKTEEDRMPKPAAPDWRKVRKVRVSA